jgi:CBS domain containing-hemolysin-like protein
MEEFRKEQYTRLPVYDESHDNVIGVINLKDIFFYSGNKDDFKIEAVMREPHFTFEFKKTSELLTELRRESVSMAIVLDEYGTVAGLVTVEDLLEEIVGEIRDEFDMDEVDDIRKLDDGAFLVQGTARLDDINEAIGLDLHSEDYESIAGHLIALRGRIPKRGELIKQDNVEYRVLSVDNNRIGKVKIIVNSEKEEDDRE